MEAYTDTSIEIHSTKALSHCHPLRLCADVMYVTLFFWQNLPRSLWCVNNFLFPEQDVEIRAFLRSIVCLCVTLFAKPSKAKHTSLTLPSHYLTLQEKHSFMVCPVWMFDKKSKESTKKKWLARASNCSAEKKRKGQSLAFFLHRHKLRIGERFETLHL